MKRLNSYLLTHYPLLWNLRVHYIWPAIIGLHALFFLWGFGDADASLARRYRHFQPSGELIAFSVLLSLLILVVWLVMFLRNNAFKSFYPLKRGRLAAEGGLIFLTTLGLCSTSNSYSVGSRARVGQMFSGVDVEAERHILNMGRHFLPFYLGNFSRFQGCYGVSQPTPSTDAADGVAVDTFSYLNFCEERTYWDESGNRLLNESGNTSRAHRWLLNGNRDSVLQVLTQYVALVKKYHGRVLFDPKAHTAAIFSTPDFKLKYTLRSDAPYNSDADPVAVEELREEALISDGPESSQAPSLAYGTRFAYIEHGRAEEAISAIAEARGGSLDFTTFMVLLYIAVAMTVLIFSYRLTELRTWFIALIGAGIWMVLIGLIAAGMQGGTGFLIFTILLEAGFTALALFGIWNGWGRRWAGVFYLWSFAGMPFLLPMLWFAIRELSRPDYTYGGTGEPSGPLYHFLSTHEEWCVASNLLVIALAILLFYIPVARKWQAMPEE